MKPTAVSRTITNLFMYDPKTGIAHIPLNGTYLFTLTVEHWHSRSTRCNIVLDGKPLVTTVLSSAGRSTQSTNSVALLLKQKQLWVECNPGKFYGDHVTRVTTFSAIYTGMLADYDKYDVVGSDFVTDIPY